MSDIVLWNPGGGREAMVSFFAAASDDQIINRFISDADVKESSEEAYKNYLKSYFSWLTKKGIRWGDVTFDVLKEYRDFVGQKAQTKSAANSYITILKMFSKWVSGLTESVDIALALKYFETKKAFKMKALNRDQTWRLFNWAEQNASLRDQAIIKFLVYTASRLIEACRMNIEDIVLEDGEYVAYTQRKGADEKDSDVVLERDCYAPILAYLSTRPNAEPCDPLFVSASFHGAGARISTRYIETLVRKAFNAIGLDPKKYTAHSLRHTAGELTVDAGGTNQDVQDLLGHASFTTSEIYVNAALKRRRRKNSAGKLLADYLKRPAPQDNAPESNNKTQ